MREDVLIRRIVVALDASRHSSDALRAAIDLARQTNAEIVGLFIEDENLLRLAGLPFAREVMSSAVQRKFDAASVERSLRASAAHLARELQRAAEPHHLRWRFVVARGNVDEQLLEAEKDADLLVIGQAGRRSHHVIEPGDTAVRVAAQATKTVLVQHPVLQRNQTLLIVFDGSPRAWRALNTAAKLRPRGRGELVLLTPPQEEIDRTQLDAELQLWCDENQLSARRVQLLDLDVKHLVSLVRRHHACGLVLSGERSDYPESAVRELLRQLSCPVLFVR
ncbi:MAG: universal stress protein [Myxococcales bacterium]|nr:universal stress protein [Myxococcales bacterium]